MKQNDEKVNAVGKSLEILLAFVPDNEAIGTVELSRKLGFHKATTSRILQNLIDFDFVQQNPHTKKFTLGPAIYKLGQAISNSLTHDLEQIAKPHLNALRDQFDETVVLEVWSGNSTLIAYIAETHRPVRVAGRIGNRLPIHAAAGAKAILAVSEPKFVKSLMSELLAALTPNTITTSADFLDNMAECRAQGFACDREELDVGISAVGVPIFDPNNNPIAAIVAVMPTQRFTDDPNSSLILSMKKTATTISQEFLELVFTGNSMP